MGFTQFHIFLWEVQFIDVIAFYILQIFAFCQILDLLALFFVLLSLARFYYLL